MTTRASTEPGRTATCVHCLLRCARRPAAGGAPPGLDGSAPIRVLDGGDGLWLVVSEVPVERYGAAGIEAGLQDIDWVARHALAHERVVEHFLDRGALIPMKLFTLYHSDANALDSLSARRAELDGVFDQVQGRREWGVRMLAAPAPARPSRRPAADGDAEASASPGTSFLRRKQSARRAAEDATAEASAAAEELYDLLADVSVRARRADLPPQAAGSPLLIDAAFLVSTRRTARFQSALEGGRARSAEQGLEIAVSGPWPAYHFIEAAG